MGEDLDEVTNYSANFNKNYQHSTISQRMYDQNQVITQSLSSADFAPYQQRQEPMQSEPNIFTLHRVSETKKHENIATQESNSLSQNRSISSLGGGKRNQSALRRVSKSQLMTPLRKK